MRQRVAFLRPWSRQAGAAADEPFASIDAIQQSRRDAGVAGGALLADGRTGLLVSNVLEEALRPRRPGAVALGPGTAAV